MEEYYCLPGCDAAYFGRCILFEFPASVITLQKTVVFQGRLTSVAEKTRTAGMTNRFFCFVGNTH